MNLKQRLWLDGEQLPIFGWPDLQHGDSPVAVFESPAPGIARCIISPVPLFCLSSATRLAEGMPARVRCAAVDDSGWNLVAPLLWFDGDRERLFAELEASLTHPQRGNSQHSISGAGNAAGPIGETLTAEKLRDPGFWRIHAGTSAQPLTVVHQWATASFQQACSALEDGTSVSITAFVDELVVRLQRRIDWLIGGLRREIREAMLARPDLDYGIVQNVLLRAFESGSNEAVCYASQAIRIEPLPLLRWIVTDTTGTLGETVLSGASLPTALRESTGASRATTRYVSRHARLLPDMPVYMFRSMLVVLERIDRNKWPTVRKDWENLSEMIRISRPPSNDSEIGLTELGVEAVLAGACWRDPSKDHSLNRRTIPWQQEVGFPDHFRPADIARGITKLHEELSRRGLGISLPDAEELQERWLQVDDKRGAAYRLAVAMGKTKLNDFCSEWLRLLPVLAPIQVGRYEFHILRSMEESIGLGKELRNCISSGLEILSYAFAGRVLLGAYKDGISQAMLSVYFEQMDNSLQMELDEFAGHDNSSVEPELETAGISLLQLLSKSDDLFVPFIAVGQALAQVTKEICRGGGK